MWISKERYNQLINIEQVNEARVNTLRLLLDKEVNRANILSQELVKSLSTAEEYKQKYADEVNKRLELIKLLEDTPLTN